MSSETTTPAVKRRDFLKVVGAGTAVASTMIGCTSEKVEKLIPYLVSPDEGPIGMSGRFVDEVRRKTGGERTEIVRVGRLDEAL